MSGRPSMKFNSHPPNGVFIKAVTITASRRARPARLGSAVWVRTVQGGRGRRRRTGDRGRLWEREREGAVWTRRRRIGAVSSRATEGLNLPKRQLSLLCNLTRTCLTCARVSTPARPGAQHQLHIGHAENYAARLVLRRLYYFSLL